MPIDLEARIARVLSNVDSPLWFPDLTRALAQTEWRRLEAVGIMPENYGTARIIMENARAQREIAPIFSTGNQKEGLLGETISVESLTSKINDYYREAGVEFYSFEEIFAETEEGDTEIICCVNAAFDIIRLIPSLFSTVAALTKSIHLIKPETDDYDVSFSEPNVPFSIFVSVPRKNTLANSLRVAESIVHEAMHLQLTLIEKIATLVTSNAKSYYSPWKDEMRSTQGILHALYVFRVIDYFFGELSNGLLKFPKAASYVVARRKEIDLQIKMIRDFAENEELTALGKILARRLI